MESEIQVVVGFDIAGVAVVSFAYAYIIFAAIIGQLPAALYFILLQSLALFASDDELHFKAV